MDLLVVATDPRDTIELRLASVSDGSVPLLLVGL
jgi:hypothetical protein